MDCSMQRKKCKAKFNRGKKKMPKTKAVKPIKNILAIVSSVIGKQTMSFIVGVYPTEYKAKMAAAKIVDKMNDIHKRLEDVVNGPPVSNNNEIFALYHEMSGLFESEEMIPATDWTINTIELTGKLVTMSVENVEDVF